MGRGIWTNAESGLIPCLTPDVLFEVLVVQHGAYIIKFGVLPVDVPWTLLWSWANFLARKMAFLPHLNSGSCSHVDFCCDFHISHGVKCSDMGGRGLLSCFVDWRYLSVIRLSGLL